MRWGLSCVNTGAIVPLKEVQNVALIGASLVHVDSNLLYLNETNKPIEANFTFPLDTGSAVYRFEAEVDGRLIIAECQEKAQARDTYQQAVQSGHTAVLLEEHQDTNDVFVCRIGNLPALQKALVKICYVSELPHDPSGALRFTLPTVLNPRYGVEHNTGPVNNRTDVICINPGSYAMSLDITVQSQQIISSIVSEKDNLNLSPANNEHVWKASVQFGQGTKVDHDITIMIKYADMHQPQAIVERGIKGQNEGILNMDTLMLSFYPKIDPKFSTTVGEFIFIIDRSGSMGGSRIASARDTLLLMIKSLPIGCFFNVYSFGDNFHILFERDSASSVEYNEENMMYALDFVQNIDADMGGTEISKPIKDMYSKPCLPGHPRQVILLTDGDVWNVGEVLSLVRRNNKSTRMFSVGIGEGASTALVKGLARAGKGRAEFVKGNDRLQTKVVSLLKSAMQSVVTNVQVTLELPPEVSGTIIPHECPSIFSGEELIMYAVLNGSESMDTIYGNIILRGRVENQTFEHKLSFEGQRQHQQLDTSLPVHRLAAKALIQELQEEELADKETDNKSKILLASMAANVISKYTSFVGVDKKSNVPLPEQSYLEIKEGNVCYGMFGASSCAMPPPSHGRFGAMPAFQFGASGGMGAPTGGMFGAKLCGFSGSQQMQFGSFGSSSGLSGQPMQATFGAKQQPGVFGSGASSSQSNMFGGYVHPQTNMFGSGAPRSAFGMLGAKPIQPTRTLSARTKLILLQKFEGSWMLNEDLASIVGTTCGTLQQIAPIQNHTVWATCLALAWLHLKESLNKDELVMIESKALAWLKQQGLTNEEVDNVFSNAQNVMLNL